MTADKPRTPKITNQHLNRLHTTIKELLAEIEAFLDQHTPTLPTIDTVITVTTIPNFTPLHRQGYRKVHLFVGYPMGLTFDIPDIGYIHINATPGWIELPLPEGTGIALTAEKSKRLLFRLCC